VSDAGDVNDDGHADVIVGAIQDIDIPGFARVYSGQDGSILYTYSDPSPDPFAIAFGVSVSGAGDVDGDGHADLIVGARAYFNVGDGFAQVFSGADGSSLYTFSEGGQGTFGYSVSGAGDVNGDGRADLIVGAFGYGDDGLARVYSGVDGSILYSFTGVSAGDDLGFSVSGAGDVNGDGRADLIAGAPAADNNGADSGSALVFSGMDGSVLYTFNGDKANDRFGTSVSDAGDVNGDGYADLIVGTNASSPESGFARVFSGADGSILYTFNGDNANDEFGYSVSGAGDVNGDGHADLIVGADGDDKNGANAGSARVFSGADGSILYTFYGDGENDSSNSPDSFGISVSGAGDMDGDGLADLIVGATGDDNNAPNSGSARVILTSYLVNDIDADNTVNSADNCPANWNPSQFTLDTDLDGAPDSCDADDDGDGICDRNSNIEAGVCVAGPAIAGGDNCRLIENPAQLDANDDGCGNRCTTNGCAGSICTNIPETY